ncbi:MAG: DUF4139 domain-containing protein [FCB group bacterium]|jgi:hypothetical protein|nr:DUF4139 domain-containing protein [FCB group bacterium]
MRTIWVACLLLGAACVAAWAQEPAPVTVSNAAEPAADARTGLENQTEVAVTIYNSNLGLVRDRRTVTLPTGELRLQFADVAQQIRPETVSLESIGAPGSVRVLEQNYEFDLISPEKLMEKYVGKKVKLVNFSTEVNLPNPTEAELLSINGGAVYRVNNEIFLGYPGQVVLPEIPENLIAKPSLVWLLQNDQAEQTIEATYLTQGMRWNADYVAVYSEDAGRMSLKGWVTLVNESGAQYTNAKLKLVAGEVNIVPPPQPMMRGGRAKGAMMEMAAAPAPQMQEEAFGEYHLYRLERPTTIKQNQSKQVSLLTAPSVGVEKTYEFRGDVSFYSQIMPPMKDQKVAVQLKFKNEEANGLGMPLPAGVVRVYEADSQGLLQFSGEDRIKHTPKDEEVKVKLGNAFDVVGERTQTDFSRIADNVYEAAFEIKIRNHKDKDITIDIVEPMTSDWSILQSSHQFKKKDAQTAIFTVPVPKDGETVVTYRVRVRY